MAERVQGAMRLGFNEAAGIHRRKPASAGARRPPARSAASMRPPEFTGGNDCVHGGYHRVEVASMRPPEFTGGNDLLE